MFLISCRVVKYNEWKNENSFNRIGKKVYKYFEIFYFCSPVSVELNVTENIVKKSPTF